MTLIKRSFIYIRRNKKSNSILFALFMFITTFVLLGCNIMEFTGHIAENLREKIGGIIYIYIQIQWIWRIWAKVSWFCLVR